MNEQQTEQMEKVTQSLMQACEDMNAIARDQMSAVMESTSAVTKGCEEISRNLGGLVQESLARAMSAGKIIMGAKSVKEAMDMQTEFVKACFDTWVAGTGRVSEISARMTQEAFEPVARQATATICKIGQQTKAA